MNQIATTKNKCAVTLGCRKYQDRVGVLMMQVGTPDAPTPKALRTYLKQFLGDKRVIEANPIVWWLVLNGIILNTRPKKSAAAYARVWTPEGSPLMTISIKQQQGISKRLSEMGYDIPIAWGMGVGNPSIKVGLEQLTEQGCRRIIVLPMFPQYAAATTGSVCDGLFKQLQKMRWVPSVRVVPPFYNDSLYRQALLSSIQEYFDRTEKLPERLLLSYHGVPQRYVKQGDPYCCMCTETTQFLLKNLKFPKEKIIQTFQSRFGREAWLQPYTDKTVEELGQAGIKHIAVASPAFAADCLETIDELGTELQEQFHEAGGEKVDRIDCLNFRPDFIECLTQLVVRNAGDWLTQDSAEYFCATCPSKIVYGDA